MTNLKRVLSLVLVLALALSMVVMGTSAAKFSDVKSTYTYSTEVQFLSDLGILTGYSDGSYKPDGIVTRAEACAVIYRMLSGKTSAANYTGDTKFPDVKAANWASGYVNFCVELGVVAGYPDGNFYPDKTLTYAEYTTMLVRALGLDQGKDPVYPFGYIALASVESVNEAVDLQASDACNRGAVAKLTYNSIINATYQRMASNIYVTTKPTIAKDVLKLLSTDGVLTSTGYYSYIDQPAAGDKNFTLSSFTASTASAANGYTPILTGEFAVAVSDLGKKATVWYKNDSTATNGIKIYAVITKADTEFNNIHIAMRGYYTATPYELTYVVSDVDKTLKVSKDCQFVENNQFLYGNNLTAADADKSDNFYPWTTRAWLPISYRFIDNDNDGYYDFAIRTVYSFAQITNLTSSKVTFSTTSSIDRQDDAGNAYAWSDSLKDSAVDDYVLYTCDGSVNSAGFASTNIPTFTSDLYDNTHAAKIIPIAKQTGAVESIVDGEKVVFGGKLYRAMKGGSFDDLTNAGGTIASNVNIGDTYDYWPIASFAMIARAESVSTSSGKYLVLTGIAAPTIGSEFKISAIDENGKENVYDVKANDTYDLTQTNSLGEKGLTYTNLNVLFTATGAAGQTVTTPATRHYFFEYTIDSTGKITSLKDHSVANTDTIPASDVAYSSTSQLLNTNNNSYLLGASTLVYVKNGSGNFKVYSGGYPTISSGETTTVWGTDYSASSGTNKLRAMYIITTDTSVSGASSTNTDLAGYLRSATVVNDNGTWYYKYNIAYGGDVTKTYTTATVSSSDDLSTLISDDTVIKNDINLGGVIMFDLDANGTIQNMKREEKFANYKNGTTTTDAQDLARDKYYGTYIATNIDTSNRLITVVPVFNNTATPVVTAGATLSTSNDSGNNYGAPVAASSFAFGTPKTYSYTSSVNVYQFDVTSTNQAYVTSEGAGILTKSPTTLATGDKLYLLSFAYNNDDGAHYITDIFYNKTPVTLGAAVAPTFTSAAAYSSTGAGNNTLSFTVDQGGTYYYLVQANGTAAPASASDIVAAATGSGTVTAATAKSVSMTGLTATNKYDVYVVVKNPAGTYSVISSVINFTAA